MGQDGTILLKCKTKDGVCVQLKLNSNNTLRELLTAVVDTTGVNPNDVTLFYDYPPKSLNVDGPNGDKELASVPLMSGSTIFIDRRKDVYPALPEPSHNTSVLNKPSSDLGVDTNPSIIRINAPSDDSCLFHSVVFLLNPVLDPTYMNESDLKVDIDAARRLRQEVCNFIRKNPISYSEAALGMTIEEYCAKMNRDQSWGGAIEVSAISQMFQTELCLIDIETGHAHYFGEDAHYATRILLLYDGIHYDPLIQRYSSRPSSSNSSIVSYHKQFSTADDRPVTQAQKLADNLRGQRKFVNVQSMSIVCRECNQEFKGQTDCLAHTKSTGHTSYVQK